MNRARQSFPLVLAASLVGGLAACDSSQGKKDTTSVSRKDWLRGTGTAAPMKGAPEMKTTSQTPALTSGGRR